MNSAGKQSLNAALPKEFGGRRREPLPGLYIHWPWCVSKCPYCDFNSHVQQVFTEKQYVEAICSELDHMLFLTGDGVEGRPALGSLFFGGGTPSLMRPDSVAAILEHVRRCFALADGMEITLEANPSSVEAARFAELAEAGVNRLSLGVQALEEEALKVLGRAHGVEEALAAIELAQKHFSRMSFDLIYARHGQALEDWRNELARALELAQGHLSLYQLSIEQGTAYQNLFTRGKLNLPDNERAARFFHETREICARAGLPAYEISNYAKAGQASAHNLVYWRYGSYMGVGPGAHGRVVVEGRLMASAVIRSPKRWIRQVEQHGHGVETLVPLTRAEQADEMILMGMRLVEGLDLIRLGEKTGKQISRTLIDQLQDADLCQLQEGRLCATTQGFAVLNQIVGQLSLALADVRPSSF